MRLVKILLSVLPLTGWLAVGACSVTDRQLSDFASSTAIRVFVQAVTSELEAVALDQLGTG
jgi:hypothetical protein